MFQPYRNQNIDLHHQSVDCFLYEESPHRVSYTEAKRLCLGILAVLRCNLHTDYFISIVY